MPIRKDPPPPLDQTQYSHIRFWTAKSFDAHFNDLVGETDGLATKEKRRGRRRNASNDEDPHPYLETAHGTRIPREILVKVGQKARRLWQALNTAGLAPSSWGKANEVAYTYFHGEMLNEPDFEFFRYCEGNWKITRWATKAYASWKHNHLRPNNAEDGRTSGTNKRKRELLDDPSLLRIDHETTENISLPLPGPSESASESTPVATHGSASHTGKRSDLDLTQVRSHLHHANLYQSTPTKYLWLLGRRHRIHGSSVCHSALGSVLVNILSFFTVTIFTIKSIHPALLAIPSILNAPSPQLPRLPLHLQSHRLLLVPLVPRL